MTSPDAEAYGEEGWTLWRELDFVSDHWYNAYREYWGLDQQACPEHLTFDQWESARRFSAAAPNLFKLGLAMNTRAVLRTDASAPMDSRTLSAFRESLSSFGQSPLVRDNADFELATDAIQRLRHATDRFVSLLDLVLDHPLSPRASDYLARATRLYVLGFDPECLVMCRAALDAALQERIDDDELQRLGIQRRDLWWRIRAAESLGLFDTTLRDSADRLRQAGNQAIHTAPGFLVEGIGDARTAVSVLSELLRALFPD